MLKKLCDVEKFMQMAILEAKNSECDIPIGCVIVKNGEIISAAHNLKEKKQDVTSHAEIEAIRQANKKLQNWRLDGCSLFVTLEPCPMCAWAILNSGIENVYFGAYDINYGAFCGKLNLLEISHKKTKIYGGILEETCEEILNEYFKKIRKN